MLINKNILNLQICCNKKNYFPKKKIILIWFNKVMFFFKKKAEITIRLVEKKEIKKLNFLYRGIKKSTEVLSFSLKDNFKKNSFFIGDIIICSEIIKKKIKIFKKKKKEYWCHIIIHSILHLLGYNHINNNEFKIMKKIELKIMKKLGYYNNPYYI